MKVSEIDEILVIGFELYVYFEQKVFTKVFKILYTWLIFSFFIFVSALSSKHHDFIGKNGGIITKRVGNVLQQEWIKFISRIFDKLLYTRKKTLLRAWLTF